MYIDYYFEEVFRKFKSELEKRENYVSDDFFQSIPVLTKLDLLDRVHALCNCAWEEIKKEPDKKAYLEMLKHKHEKYIRKPLFSLIEEVYYYSRYTITPLNKEKKGYGVFAKPANECSEDFINQHQAVKAYRYYQESTGRNVICNYAVGVVNGIWDRIEEAVEYEIKKQEIRNASNPMPKERGNLPEDLNTDEAKKIFPKAVKAGLMQPLSNGSGYRWNRSNALLAYLCGKIYCGDSLKRDAISKEWRLKRGETFFPETALMSFFVNKEEQAIKNLGQSRLQIQRPPRGHKDIDKLFDEAT